MLLHLPVVMLATLSPIPVSDTIPKFDIAKECRFESESSAVYQRCSQDEADALEKLQTEWPQFIRAERSSCEAEATIGGSASYVELLICLEMARDVDKEDANTRDADEGKPAPATPGETTVVDKHE
jgi:hypothetical protein